MRRRILLYLLSLLLVGAVLGGWAFYRHAGAYRSSLAFFALDRLHMPGVASLLDPRDSSLAYKIGNFYLGENAHDLEKAEKYYKKALELGYAEPAYLYFGLSRAYFFEGRYNKAIEAINETMRLNPSIRNTYYMRGLIYGYKNSLPEAEADFSKFLELKPESWAGANDLAWIYFRQGKFVEVKTLMEQALIYNPENPWLHNSLGVALLNTGNKEGARAAFEEALTAFKAMTPGEWGRAYPGNDARYHAQGLASTIHSIEKNLALLPASGASKAQ